MLNQALYIKLTVLLLVIVAAVVLAATKAIPGSEALDLVKYVASAFTVGVGILGAGLVKNGSADSSSNDKS